MTSPLPVILPATPLRRTVFYRHAGPERNKPQKQKYALARSHPIALVNLICLLLVVGVPSLADTITTGAPGNPFDGDCAPFGCALEYQQVYSAGLFSGAITITDLTFFNTNFVPGSIAAANYTISLSTTTAAVDGLDATFANNLGTDNALFFGGALGGLVGPTNQVTISGTPFGYDPAAGNLLLTVTSDGSGFDFSVFLDFLSSAPAGTFSRLSSFDTSGVADTIQNDTGLVTQFTFSPATSSVPEPASWLFLGSAILALLALDPRCSAQPARFRSKGLSWPIWLRLESVEACVPPSLVENPSCNSRRARGTASFQWCCQGCRHFCKPQGHSVPVREALARYDCSRVKAQTPSHIPPRRKNQ